MEGENIRAYEAVISGHVPSLRQSQRWLSSLSDIGIYVTYPQVGPVYLSAGYQLISQSESQPKT